MIAHGFMASMGILPQDASIFVVNLLSGPCPSSRFALEHKVWSSRTESVNIKFYSISTGVFDIVHLNLTERQETLTGGDINGPNIWSVVMGIIEFESVKRKPNQRG